MVIELNFTRYLVCKFRFVVKTSESPVYMIHNNLQQRQGSRPIWYISIKSQVPTYQSIPPPVPLSPPAKIALAFPSAPNPLDK